MKRIFLFLILAGLLFELYAADNPRILVFSKTSGYRHASISTGMRTVFQLGELNGFDVDTTRLSSQFTKKGLKAYAAVVFLSTSEDVLNESEQIAFQNYIESGGGFVGVHAAADSEYDWPWFLQLVGGYFNGHPAIQEAKIVVVDTLHAATRHLPRVWVRTDEWYNYRDLQPDLSILAWIDEGSYTGGTNGSNHPIAWYHAVGKGRSFYTGLGHTEESYSEPLFQQHLLGGILYAIGR